MKYICPYCKNEITIHWWKTKLKFKCPNCNQLVFETAKTKLKTLNFISAFLSVLTCRFIIAFINIAVWEKVLLIVLAVMILCVIIYFIEIQICQKSTS